VSRAANKTHIVAAVVGYGDPGRVNGESWNQGTATRNGVSSTNKLFD
jgi:hypothetical protein